MGQSPKVAAKRRLKKFSGGPAYPPMQTAKPLASDKFAALFRWMLGKPKEVEE